MIPKLLWLVLTILLYFTSLGSIGLMGPDEPRYAQVAREMLRSGDWVTPHLSGRPWFEKPPLYYWMAAAAFRVFGVNEFAARLPCALGGAAFLLLFAWAARQLYRGETAAYAVLVLASTAGWIGFSRAASPEILFTASVAGALSVGAVWLWFGRKNLLYAIYALLGLAMLAKGPAALVLAGIVLVAYCVATGEYRWFRQVLAPGPLLVFLAIAAPWYVAVYLANGYTFIDDFILKHHFSRFATAELAHPGPWWYYAPVLLGLLFPWTAHLWLIGADLKRLGRSGLAKDHRRVFLLAWIVPVVLFFSLSQAKLPGYVLVTAPPLALWIGNELARAPATRVRWVTLVQAVLLPLLAVAAEVLPAALSRGLRSAGAADLRADPLLLAFSVAGGLVIAVLAWRARRFAATAAAALLTALMIVRIIAHIAPAADRLASARSLARDIQSRGIDPSQISLHPRARRHVHYGLEFYLDHPLPRSEEGPFVITAEGGIVQSSKFKVQSQDQ